MAADKMFKGVLYIDGVYMENVAGMTVPGPTATVSTFDTLSSLGSINLPNGFDAMEGTIDWKALTPEILKYVSNTRDVFKLQLRSNLERYGGTVNKVDVAVIFYISARFRNMPGAEFEAKNDSTSQTTYDALYVRCVIDGKDQYEFDPVNQIHKVNGVSLIDKEKRNLGLI